MRTSSGEGINWISHVARHFSMAESSEPSVGTSESELERSSASERHEDSTASGSRWQQRT